MEHNLVIHLEYLHQPSNKSCQPVLALWGCNRRFEWFPFLSQWNVRWLKSLVIYLCSWLSTLIASAFLLLSFLVNRLFHSKVLHPGDLSPDIIHKNSRVFVVLQRPWTWLRLLAFLPQDLSAVQFLTALFHFKPVRTRSIDSGSARATDISYSSMSSVNSSLLEWGAEEALSASGNGGESVRATAIDWGLRATASTSSGHFNGGVGSKSTWHSRDWCESATTINQRFWSLFGRFIVAALDWWRVSTRATTSPRSGHCIGKIKSLIR